MHIIQLKLRYIMKYLTFDKNFYKLKSINPTATIITKKNSAEDLRGTVI